MYTALLHIQNTLSLGHKLTPLLSIISTLIYHKSQPYRTVEADEIINTPAWERRRKMTLLLDFKVYLLAGCSLAFSQTAGQIQVTNSLAYISFDISELDDLNLRKKAS